MKYGFVYIWRDSAKSKIEKDQKIVRYYIGCHWGYEDDGYICSSNWMRDAMRRRPNDFKRRILSIVYNKNELLNKECEWLSLIKKEELGKRYYNIINWKIPYLEEETKKKISNSNKGKKSSKGMTGKHHTKKTKEKMKLAHAGENNIFFNKSHTKESIQKMKLAKLGKPRKPFTQATKKKMSKIHEGIKNPMFGKSPWNKGKSWSDETKEKMKQSRLTFLSKCAKNKSFLEEINYEDTRDIG